MRFDANTSYATGTLKAPIAGVVVDTAGTVGQRVEAGSVLVKVADSSQLNYESATSHSITVLATSTDGSTNSETFTIAVTNVNDNLVVGPTDSNAHPHLSEDRRVAVIHNGIIENFAVLREELTAAGVRFTAEVYPGARHGYSQPDTAAYNAEAADLGIWRHRRKDGSLIDVEIPAAWSQLATNVVASKDGEKVLTAGDGGVDLKLDPELRELLASLAGQLSDLIDDPEAQDGPGLARLFPPASMDDPLEALGFEQLMGDALRAGKRESAAVVRATAHATHRP